MLLILAVMVLVAQPALAQDNMFKVFGGLAYISPLDDEEVDFGTVKDSIEASEELGWTVGIEIRFTDAIGLELDAVRATHDIEFGGDAIGEIDFTPLSASLNFHIVHTTIVDLYIAPTATYILWGDLEFDSSSLGDLDAENDFAYGASVGLDIGLGDNFAIFGGVRWLNADIEPDDGDEEIGVDPLISRLGVAFRF
jgi:outer membrane protein W